MATRALTFHLFFEIRSSRGERSLASFLNVFIGIFSFGLAPGIMARFVVYFCDLPAIRRGIEAMAQAASLRLVGSPDTRRLPGL